MLPIAYFASASRAGDGGVQCHSLPVGEFSQLADFVQASDALPRILQV